MRQTPVSCRNWVKLYQANPLKTLSFRTPTEAVASVLEPSSITTVGELCRSYLRHAEDTVKFTRSGDINPNFHRLQSASMYHSGTADDDGTRRRE